LGRTCIKFDQTRDISTSESWPGLRAVLRRMSSMSNGSTLADAAKQELADAAQFVLFDDSGTILASNYQASGAACTIVGTARGLHSHVASAAWLCCSTCSILRSRSPSRRSCRRWHGCWMIVTLRCARDCVLLGSATRCAAPHHHRAIARPQTRQLSIDV
jgi:hypothetical protein